MSLDLYRRVKALEAEVKALRESMERWRADGASQRAAAVAVIDACEKKPQTSTRQMCPKCGEKPNYFFHVKTCAGPKQKQERADDGSGSTNTT